MKIVDVGGDHRFVEGWTYGLTELPGSRAAIARSSRVSDPGCYPAAALLALAPLVAGELVEPEGLIVDAKTGVSGAGRGGGGSAFGYAETNEDVLAYGLAEHPHVPEMQEALTRLGGRRATLAFTPHLVPMTRGILATCYARPRGAVTAARLEDAARALYRDEPFVRVAARPGRAEPPHQVGDRLERRLRLLRDQPGDGPRGGPRGARQPRQGRRGSGRPEREPHDRPAGDGGPDRSAALAVGGVGP